MSKSSNSGAQLHKQRGVTFMEIMIALVIVGICMAIALPSYRTHQIKSKRASAQAHLLEIAQAQQQYLLDARAYAANLTALNVTTPTLVSTFYTITMSVASGPPTFTITATPRTGTAQATDSTLTVNQAGIKTPSDKW
jgi:type IV pilus assembly protein PilE